MEPMVKMSHIRAAGYCARGLRPFLERHGIDRRQLVSCGIPVSVVEATGDAMAMRVAEIARKEVSNGR
jgi:hypothetical protein